VADRDRNRVEERYHLAATDSDEAWTSLPDIVHATWRTHC